VGLSHEHLHGPRDEVGVMLHDISQQVVHVVPCTLLGISTEAVPEVHEVNEVNGDAPALLFNSAVEEQVAARELLARVEAAGDPLDDVGELLDGEHGMTGRRVTVRVHLLVGAAEAQPDLNLVAAAAQPDRLPGHGDGQRNDEREGLGTEGLAWIDLFGDSIEVVAVQRRKLLRRKFRFHQILISLTPTKVAGNKFIT
jgi:hypothetical protein